jgi:hypothetical protein
MRPIFERKIMDKFKKVMSTTGKGILAVGAAVNNAPIHQRIDEIDAEIARLQEEKANLEDKLIEL